MLVAAGAGLRSLTRECELHLRRVHSGLAGMVIHKYLRSRNANTLVIRP